MSDNPLGRELIIKMGDGEVAETFENVCGLRTRSFSISTNEVDTTVPNCDNPGGPLQKTSRPGMRDNSFSGSGLFLNKDVMKRVATAATLGTEHNMQVIVPNLGTFQGSFGVFDFELTGEMEEDLGFSATFRPTEELTFTAAVS